MKALDGLRGIAVALILLFHAGHIQGGWIGVDLFFVLSGFLITSLLLFEWDDRGAISLSAFWTRRARRLLPALCSLLLGASAWALLFATPGELARIRADGLATLFYVANWHAIYAGHDYWEIFRSPSPLDHTWSLAIEEQFYLLWPPVVLILLGRFGGSHRGLTALAGSLALASAGWMFFLFDPAAGTARVYFGSDTRAAATLIGAAVAASQQARLRNWPQPGHSSADLLAALALIVIGCAAVMLEGSSPVVYRGGLFGLILASGAVIVGILAAPDGFVSRMLSIAPLRGLGLISYGVYLWHWPIYLAMTQERLGFGGMGLTTARIGVTLVVAVASYFLVERPIRRGQLEARQLWAGASASTAVVLVAGAFATSGAVVERSATVATDSTQPLDVLLIGDSVPYILGPEFVKVARQRELEPMVMGVEACASLRSTGLRYLSGHQFDLTPCLRQRERWLATIDARKPRAVIILEGWSGEGSKMVRGEWSEPCSEHFDASYREDLSHLVSRIAANGGTPLVVTMPPPDIRDLPSKYSRLWGGMPRAELDALFRERVSCQNRVKYEVARSTRAWLVDLDSEVCPRGECKRHLGDGLLRSDGMHFEGAGAAWASNWLLDQVPSP